MRAYDPLYETARNNTAILLLLAALSLSRERTTSFTRRYYNLRGPGRLVVSSPAPSVRGKAKWQGEFVKRGLPPRC